MADEQLIDLVRRRAYQIWENAGRPKGRDLDHWLQAEMECRLKTAPHVTAAEQTAADAAGTNRLKRRQKPGHAAPRGSKGAK
jgi:Protein of unknown function (DUF2934)